MSRRVGVHHGVVPAIGIAVIAVRTAVCAEAFDVVRADKPPRVWVIVARIQVIPACLPVATDPTPRGTPPSACIQPIAELFNFFCSDNQLRNWIVCHFICFADFYSRFFGYIYCFPSYIPFCFYGILLIPHDSVVIDFE